MNLIYITGASCCGKSTLADKMSRQYDNATILSLDAFSKSIRSVFTDFKLYTDEISIKPIINNDKFLMLVKKYIECYFDDYNHVLIVEGCHFTPEEFMNEFPVAKVIALGIRGKEKALQQINKKAWMAGLNESIKNEYSEKISEYSGSLKENPKNYFYFDIDDAEQALNL